MQILLITMSKDIQQFVNTMNIIEETRMSSATIEGRVQMTDNEFSLIETCMKLFENHVDTVSLY